MLTANNINWMHAHSTESLKSQDLQDQQCIWIENIIHYKLDYIPMNVKYLTIRDCNLLSLKELKNITSLEYLDISLNPVFSLNEIESHKKLITLIINNTMIMNVSQVSELNCLTEFNAENCFILNALPIVDHPNFVLKWLSKQLVPDKDHVQTYMIHYLKKEDEDLFNFEMAKKLESDYMVKMIERYGPLVKDGKIVVENDQEVTHFRFVDCIRAISASFNKCFNPLHGQHRFKKLFPSANPSQSCCMSIYQRSRTYPHSTQLYIISGLQIQENDDHFSFSTSHHNEFLF
ncbi:Leucine-rich_repeat domain superfamily [Hexamita inflata]|uniref:Leucine-rich repeat domain superfamily n=1 Tax=Hexamita inflata TaxID=28002 RepID=A0AA86QTM8_9EUKA|nr:Leucine-rich repeat domain superfamily [Hexamita inflata]